MAIQATQPIPTASASNAPSKRQVAGIVLMAGGWGWISGNFVDPFLPFFFGGVIDIVHFVPVIALLLLSLRFLRPAEAAPGGAARAAGVRPGRGGITVVALFSVLACAVFVVLGLTNPDPNSVGVHTVEDWLPVIALNAGTVLWLSGLIPGRRS